MKTLKDLGLCKKSHAKVEAWLHEWLEMLIKNADGQQGNVYRADFETKNFFYFTDCRDLISKEIESKAQETSKAVIVRKRYIMNQLLVKSLLGEVKLLKLECSHCGCKKVWIDSFEGGFMRYCPKCKVTQITIFPNAYDTCIADVKTIIFNKFPNEKAKAAMAKYGVTADAKKMIEEIKSYHYKPDPRLKDIITKRRKEQLCELCKEPLTLIAVENKMVCTNAKCGKYGLAVEK